MKGEHMPRWIVTGADRQTAEDITQIIEADTPSQAEKKALQTMYVATIDIEQPPPHKPPASTSRPAEPKSQHGQTTKQTYGIRPNAHIRRDGSTAYCTACKRNVGVRMDKASTAEGCIVPLVFFFLGLIVPLWPITLPILWGIAIFIMIWTRVGLKRRCSIFGASSGSLRRAKS